MTKAFLTTLTQFTEPNADADHISLLINKKKKIHQIKNGVKSLQLAIQNDLVLFFGV